MGTGGALSFLHYSPGQSKLSTKSNSQKLVIMRMHERPEFKHDLRILWTSKQRIGVVRLWSSVRSEDSGKSVCDGAERGLACLPSILAEDTEPFDGTYLDTTSKQRLSPLCSPVSVLSPKKVHVAVDSNRISPSEAFPQGRAYRR